MPITALSNTTSFILKPGSAAAEDNTDAVDFTRITPNKMFDSMNALIKSGKMSVDESSGILGIMPLSALTGLGYHFAQAPDRPMDFIAGMKQLISYGQYSHNASGLVYAQKGLDALLRLQNQGSSVDFPA